VNLSAAEARSRLADARVARLATADAGGRPHLVPVTFAVDSDADVICIAIDHKPKTTTNLKRLRNIAENPAVSLLADHYAEDWDTLWWARADGQASVVTGEAAGAEDEALRVRCLDQLAGKYPQYRERRPEGPVIVIAVTRWTGWTSAEQAHPPRRSQELRRSAERMP
jgi:PPOX class probable F420-dependent enzyme